MFLKQYLDTKLKGLEQQGFKSIQGETELKKTKKWILNSYFAVHQFHPLTELRSQHMKYQLIRYQLFLPG